MLATIGVDSLEALIDATVPADIRLDTPMTLAPPADRPRGEAELLDHLHSIARTNQVFRSCIGLGYHTTITPAVIIRNILENPGWYTQYTPYQSEISQGRLEMLLIFQTLVSELTALPIAGASLLDEATAAAESMAMCANATRRKRFIVASNSLPQTIAVMQTRADSLGIELLVSDDPASEIDQTIAGVFVSYPAADGSIGSHGDLAEKAHACGALLVTAADPMALVLLDPPGHWGADIAIGSMQRFGVPMGFGGPHAAYMACTQKLVRKMPGRIIGVSKDALGNPAYRMAIQTREQHIKRDRATSNICTAQALLAIISAAYAMYHGPSGLTAIASRIRQYTCALRAGLVALGHTIDSALTPDRLFDTLLITPDKLDAAAILNAARDKRINLRDCGDGRLGITLDEASDIDLLADLLEVFTPQNQTTPALDVLLEQASSTPLDSAFARTGKLLEEEVFNKYHSETAMMRFLAQRQSKDLSLIHAMIPLGSCTMKLNAASEMLPITWPEFARLHPFAPAEQTRGYQTLITQLETWLAQITGFAAVSLQPNAGSQGEYTGLRVISAYLDSIGQGHRNICLIPASAHGTNPASAVIAGMKVVVVACDDKGNIDIDDLRDKATQHADNLAALMVTYPSTHGVYETPIAAICQIIHDHGGQVYMDGANMNAQVGLTSPGTIGADVCHLNLHKTFCIPHGGGGPGVGPIGVAQHLAAFLPTHPLVSSNDDPQAIGPVSAAPYGSPSILPISWMYIAMMGAEGLKHATEMAILNANYMAARLKDHYDILFTGPNGTVAHEFIIDCRPFEKSAGIKVDDIAKRLMDYSFHAPTMSFPVPGTLMIEPTESEPLSEIDRLCDALIAIRREIAAIESGQFDKEDNPLRHAPHTASMIASDHWPHAYSRKLAAYPDPSLRAFKFWPACARVDNPWGDRNLHCTCSSIAEFLGQ